MSDEIFNETVENDFMSKSIILIEAISEKINIKPFYIMLKPHHNDKWEMLFPVNGPDDYDKLYTLYRNMLTQNKKLFVDASVNITQVYFYEIITNSFISQMKMECYNIEPFLKVLKETLVTFYNAKFDN